MVFDYIEKYPHRTKQILGISYEQLQSLLNCAIKRHQKIKTNQEIRKIRINAVGGGRKGKLLIQEQVCLCLSHLPHFNLEYKEITVKMKAKSQDK
jgi:hypothetical protein